MPDITAISAVLASLNALKNIAQAMIGLHDTQAFQAKIIEFNGTLLEAQAQIFSVNEERSALIERIGRLEKQMVDLETWEAEKQRYELHAITPGSFAYTVKAAERGTEPLHYICANCYQHRKKAILQKQGAPTTAGAALGIHPMYVCPECKTKIVS